MKRFRLVALNLIITLIGLELLGVSGFALMNSEFYYTAHLTGLIPGLTLISVPEASGRGMEAEDAPGQRYDPMRDYGGVRAHPYLGYILNGRLPSVPEREHEFIVGLFGGSVMDKMIPTNKDAFIARLQAAGVASGRKIEVVYMGANGERQPQFLQALSYYLSRGAHFDAVVLLDGINEVAHALNNEHHGISQYMPYFGYMVNLREMGHLGGLAENEVRQLLRVERAREAVKYWQSVYRKSPSAFIGVLAYEMAYRRYNGYMTAANDLQNSESREKGASNLYLEPSSNVNDAAILARATANWAKSSIMMHTLLAAEHVPFLHVLQPVKFYTAWLKEHSRPKIDNIGDDYTEVAVIEGYPMLLEQAPALIADGVSFFDATGIFNSVSEPVYADPCCHFNKKGADIIMNAIADALIKQLKNRIP